MSRRVPAIAEESVICPDCLLPFRRVVGSRRLLCPACAGLPTPGKENLGCGGGQYPEALAACD